MFERFARTALRNFWIARRDADVDDDAAHRLRAGRVDFFAIHGIARVDGRAASDFLVYRDNFRTAIFGGRIFAIERPVARGFPHMGRHFSARRGTDDDGAEADSRDGGHVFPDGEKILSRALG